MKGFAICFLISFFCLLGCRQQTSVLQADDDLQNIKDSIVAIAKNTFKNTCCDTYSFEDFLYNHGSYHIAKYEIAKRRLQFNDVLYLSNIAWQIGWYDQADTYAKQAIKMAHNKTDKAKGLLAQWQCDLNDMDTVKSGATLNKLKPYNSLLNESQFKLEYLVNTGYHYHNKKEYSKAILQFHEAVDFNKKVTKADSIWLGNSYHKLGNSFNDILRDTITQFYSRKMAYDSARFFYKKALLINERLYPTIHPRIAITYINLGLTERSNGHLHEAERMYIKAFDHLTKEKKTIQPIYTSIALTQLSETYLKKFNKNKSKIDFQRARHYSSLNNEFLKDEVLNYSTNAGRENLIKYFNQRSFETFGHLEGAQYKPGTYNPNETLLQLSKESKYMGTIKSYVQNNEDVPLNIDKDEALRMLNELYLINKDSNVTTKLDQWYNVLNKKPEGLTARKTDLNTTEIADFCRANNTQVIDYFISKNQLFIHHFSQSKATLIVKELNNSFINETFASKMYQYMIENKIDSFQNISSQCYFLLFEKQQTFLSKFPVFFSGF